MTEDTLVSLTELENHMKSIPSYGDHMTMEEFKAACDDGVFISYDGTGHYATATHMSKRTVKPTDVRNNRHDRTFSHVVWFNR